MTKGKYVVCRCRMYVLIVGGAGGWAGGLYYANKNPFDGFFLALFWRGCNGKKKYVLRTKMRKLYTAKLINRPEMKFYLVIDSVRCLARD